MSYSQSGFKVIFCSRFYSHTIPHHTCNTHAPLSPLAHCSAPRTSNSINIITETNLNSQLGSVAYIQQQVYHRHPQPDISLHSLQILKESPGWLTDQDAGMQQ